MEPVAFLASENRISSELILPKSKSTLDCTTVGKTESKNAAAPRSGNTQKTLVNLWTICFAIDQIPPFHIRSDSRDSGQVGTKSYFTLINGAA
jgi:hypothetical protein